MNFPILYVLFSDITAAFNLLPGAQIKKIAFQFHFNNNGVPEQPTLAGYVGKQNGEFTTNNPVIVLQKSLNTNPINLALPLHLGTIEFTRPYYNSLINPQTYLVFIPIKSTIYPDSVTYVTAWSQTIPLLDEITTMAIGDELNPSPPARPEL